MIKRPFLAGSLARFFQVGSSQADTGREVPWRTWVTAYAFAAPWVIGFLLIYAVPLAMSAYYSFTNFNMIREPNWIGLRNYERILTTDPRFWKTVTNTIYYAGLHVPINLIGALLIAIWLNQKLMGTNVFRTIIFVPAVLSGVAMALVWKWMLNPNVGVINWILSWVGIEGPAWLYSVVWAKPAFVLMGFWGLGPTMVIYLAALQGIPRELYEAAEIDGAGPVRKFWSVTLPMLAPVTLFNSITLIIASFKIFTPAWVLTSSVNAIGTPGDSTLFYVVYLFWRGFVRFEMGYASALAWLLTLVVILITLAQLRIAQWLSPHERM